ncbi:hypothetical protein AYO44_07650 [Planctomycetaceae bacterium SCGC AG-212-F19]|nr:hypothetical protein AYO44_07650 [Planctomycetaceae bacterium SCGC AG-212-F19]
MKRLWRYWPAITLAVWITWWANTAFVGTAAPGFGRIADGRWFISNRFGETEVSGWVFALSVAHFVVAMLFLGSLAIYWVLRFARNHSSE